MPVDHLKQQYNLLKGSRQVLFTYCETIDADDFTRGLEGFNNSSIRDLLCHIARCYVHWLQNYGLNKMLPHFDNAAIQSIHDIYPIYQQTNQHVNEFLDVFADNWDIQVTRTVPGKDYILTTTPLTLFTHVLTHEFHHKGQIVSMSRQMGYIPVDTDVIRS
jgi:uncharacterized damage-inducible protein DinB